MVENSTIKKLPSLVKEGQGWLVIIIFLFSLTACGSSNETSTGSLSFGLRWEDNQGLRAMAAGDPQIDCAASGVATVQANILDAAGNPFVSSDIWPCSAHSGIVSGIPEGENRKADILGKNSAGAIIYKGSKSGISIKKGEVTQVGAIEMEVFEETPTPSPSPTPIPTVTPSSTPTPTATATPAKEETVTIDGLIWQKEDDNKTRIWDAAVNYCDGLSLGGYSDWRLPSIDELKLIIDKSRTNPAINTTDFPNTNSADFWSATTYATNTNNAWYVNFYYGNVYNYRDKTNSYYVRCVRTVP